MIIDNIEDYSEAQLQQVRELDREQLLDLSWNNAQWESSLGEAYLLVSNIEDEKVYSFALFLHLRSENKLHLLKLVTAESSKRKGMARSVIDFVQSKYKPEAIYLEVKSSNLVAIKFYEKLGFKVLNQVKSFYRDGTNAFTMQR